MQLARHIRKISFDDTLQIFFFLFVEKSLALGA